MLVDSHCHLDRIDLSAYQGDLSQAIAAAKVRGITRMLCIGIDMANAQTVVDIAKANEGIYASVGIHPMDVGDCIVDQASLQRLLAESCVVAVGETGLDYFYSKDNISLQQESFKLHLQLAADIKKPAVVHTRNAREDTLAIIKQYGDPSVGGVLHCFTENWEMAKKALDENYFISFSGIVTFKNAQELRDVVKKVPLDRLLIETDSPYLAPVPYRGKKNEPKFLYEVAECVAQIKGLSVDELAGITSDNFDRLFLGTTPSLEA